MVSCWIFYCGSFFFDRCTLPFNTTTIMRYLTKPYCIFTKSPRARADLCGSLLIFVDLWWSLWIFFGFFIVFWTCVDLFSRKSVNFSLNRFYLFSKPDFFPRDAFCIHSFILYSLFKIIDLHWFPLQYARLYCSLYLSPWSLLISTNLHWPLLFFLNIVVF